MIDWYTISSVTLVATAFCCSLMLWVLRGRSRAKTVLAVPATLLTLYALAVSVLYAPGMGFAPQKLEFSYGIYCLVMTTLVLLYFRTLMQPWRPMRAVLAPLAWSLAGYALLWTIIRLADPRPLTLHTMHDVAVHIGRPMVWLRIMVFVDFSIRYAVMLSMIFRMYLRHTQDIAALFSYRERINLRWVAWLVWVNAFYGLWTLIDVLFTEGTGGMFIASNFMFAAIYLATSLLGVSQQDIYTPEEVARLRGEPAAPLSPGGIPAAMRDKLAAELAALMQRERVYLNPDLKLDMVARMLSTNRTYVSAVIRENFNDNFIGFVNGYRIREALGLLDADEGMTLDEIAERVGFKSRSSFNEFFRRNTGISPSGYRRSNAS